MVLKPKTVDPGWARRWTRQSIDLFRRSPALALVNMGIFFGVNAFVPQPLELNVPATIFLLGGLFSGLRAADRDSGNVWAAAWAYFRETVRDLAHLSRDVFLWMLVFSLSLAIFFAMFHIATEGLTQDPSASTVRLYDALPFWLRQGVYQGGNMDILGIFLPGSIPLVYLTMLTGNQWLLHYHTGYRAAALNVRFTYTVTIAGMILCALSVPLLPRMPSFPLGLVLMFLYAPAFWWFGTWGYLWCREMFEGDQENAKVTQKRTVAVPTLSAG